MKTKIICDIGSNWECADDLYNSINEIRKLGCIPKIQLEYKRTPKKYRIPYEWIPSLISAGAIYSIFDHKIMQKLVKDNLVPNIIKIASSNCLDEKLAKVVAPLGKNVVVSVGGCTLDEIRKVSKMWGDWRNLTLMHCIMDYPAECMYLGNLRDRVIGSRLIPWGCSSHSISMLVPAFSVVLGAACVEVHYKLRDMDTPDNGHSFNSGDLELIKCVVLQSEHQMKTSEQPLPCEKKHLRKVGR